MPSFFAGMARTLWVKRWLRQSGQDGRAIRRAKPFSCRARLHLEQLEERCMPSATFTTYTVNSLADNDPGGVSTSGTLRHVLDLANANHTGTAASPDLINFS